LTERGEILLYDVSGDDFISYVCLSL
jgi:hypothetical protein